MTLLNASLEISSLFFLLSQLLINLIINTQFNTEIKLIMTYRFKKLNYLFHILLHR